MKTDKKFFQLTEKVRDTGLRSMAFYAELYIICIISGLIACFLNPVLGLRIIFYSTWFTTLSVLVALAGMIIVSLIILALRAYQGIRAHQFRRNISTTV